VASFEALCQVVDVIVMAKKQATDINQSSDALASAVGRFLRLHTAAYGEGHLKPKHHWLMDVPPQLKRHSLVLDAFVVERNHLMVKQVANQVCNTENFEASVLRGLVHVKLLQAKAAKAYDTLVGKIEHMPGTASAVVADRMLISMFEVAVGDVVVRGDCAGRIVACACEHNLLFAVVEPMPLVARTGAHTLVVKPSSITEIWPAIEIEHVVGWYFTPDGNCTVVML
jgi:hypothetical protein